MTQFVVCFAKMLASRLDKELIDVVSVFALRSVVCVGWKGSLLFSTYSSNQQILGT